MLYENVPANGSATALNSLTDYLSDIKTLGCLCLLQKGFVYFLFKFIV